MSKTPLFRADHVGSLLRPSTLREAFKKQHQGKITSAEFCDIQDTAVEDAIKLQEESGLRSITDGEFRRISYWGHFVEAVDGFTVGKSAFVFKDDAGNQTEFLAPHVEAPVKRTRPISGSEFEFVKAHSSQTPKVTLPSPPTMHFWRGAKTMGEDSYSDIDHYFADLAKIYQQEIADLADRGCTYIQFDEVPLAMLGAAEVRQKISSSGEDSESLIEKYISLINSCLAKRPSSMTVSMHLCQGNFKGRWLSAGSYEHVGERLFNEVNVDTFFLEYDSPRVGDFRPLRHVPHNKSVILGLISSKMSQLESMDMLQARVEEATQFIDINQLGISPQCGFASTVGGNPVTIDDQKRKLALVVETAVKIWGTQ